jgi:hypothetical protein
MPTADAVAAWTVITLALGLALEFTATAAPVAAGGSAVTVACAAVEPAAFAELAWKVSSRGAEYAAPIVDPAAGATVIRPVTFPAEPVPAAIVG